MTDPRLWDIKFLDCCLAAPVCMLACCCPGIVQAISLFKENKPSCCPCLFAQYCCCIGLSMNRAKIRDIHNLDGDKLMECLLYCCCCCCCHACLATQEYRQCSIKD